MTLIIDMIEVAFLLGCTLAVVAVVIFAVSSLSERMTQKTPSQPIAEDPHLIDDAGDPGDPQPLVL
jgi:hypothetical protein